MSKSKRANRIGETSFVEKVFLKRVKPFPERIGIGTNTSETWDGPFMEPNSMKLIKTLVIKGRPSYMFYEIPLTKAGWKQLRRVCRQAIKMIEDEEIKIK